MLEDIIKAITPDLVINTIQKNPLLVSQVLHKFDAFIALGQALNTQQQIYLSQNISKLSMFLKEPDVKEAIGILADAFIKKTSDTTTQLPETKSTK